MSADLLPHPSFAEEVARAYFPDTLQWDAVRPIVSQLDVSALSRGRRPGQWAQQPLAPHVESATGRAGSTTPFARVTALLFAVDLNELARVLDDDTAPVRIEPGAVGTVLQDAVEWLATQLLRVLVTDLHAQRAAGTLVGETPEARFEDFRRSAESPDALRSVAERFPQLVDTGSRRLRGLADQARRLRATLTDAPASLVPPDQDIARLSFGVGDTHQGGLSTAIITWGDGRRTVFKPRDLGVEVAFYEVCEELFEQDRIPFRTPVIHRSPHGGLMEFVEARLPTHDEVPAYYENLGRVAALMYLLGGRDVHFQNVIADGTVPLPIDLECLLQGETHEQADLPPSATLQITRSIADSVLASMVLPTALESGGTVFRLGASGMVGEQQSPLRTFAVENGGRDDMRIVLQGMSMSFDLTVPEIDVDQVDPHDLMDWVGAGVHALLEAVRRDAHRYADLVVAAFRGVTVRYLNAPSMAYGQLLRMLTHPSLGASADLSAYAASRAATFGEVGSVALLQSECHQLLDGDVPFFVFRPESTTVHAVDGARAEVFVRAPLDDAVSRIRSLAPATIDEQVALARRSFVSHLGPAAESTHHRLDLDAPPHDRDATLALARRIGDELLDTVVAPVADDDVPNWRDIRISATGEGLWTPGPADQFVYGGFTGTASFLWHLGRLARERSYTDVSLSILSRLARQILDAPDRTTDFGIGASCGMAGIADVLLTVAHDLREVSQPDADTEVAELLTDAGLLVLREARDRVGTTDGPADFMSGVGGLLGVVTSLRDRGILDGDSLGEIAAHAIGRLGRLADAGDELFAFTGFAHGVSGVRPFVAAWPTVTGRDSLVDRLGSTLDAAHISPTEGWRTSTQHAGRAYGWCHGSPGILLGEVLTSRHAEASQQRITDAMRLTETECFGRSFGLCHGDLGNIEILHTAHRVLGTGHADRVGAAWGTLLHQVDAHIRSPRPPRGAFTNSLLVGRVGLGYQALRLVDPTSVPSTLW